MKHTSCYHYVQLHSRYSDPTIRRQLARAVHQSLCVSGHEPNRKGWWPCHLLEEYLAEAEAIYATVEERVPLHERHPQAFQQWLSRQIEKQSGGAS